MRKYSEYSDLELIELYSTSKNPMILGEFYQRYGHLAFGLALKLTKNKEDSEDITLSLFEKLGELLTKHKISYFQSWFYQVVRNECFMQLRKRSKIQEVEYHDAIESEYCESESEQLANELLNCFDKNLASGIAQLKLEQKQAIELFYISKKSYHEISSMMIWDITKVKSYIQNAKRNLKNILEKMCNEK
jgi:RNA polymerase sigma-70 factor (ECF subfamily)